MNLMHTKLSDVLVTLESGGRPEAGTTAKGYAFSLGAEHLDDNGGFDFRNKRFVPESFFGSMRRGIVCPEEILIVKDGATTGKVAYVDKNFPYKKSSVNEHLFKLKIDKSNASPKFVFYYLMSTEGNRQVMLDFHGSTVGGITQSFIDGVEIPLPKKDEQKRIALILDKADWLRRGRLFAQTLSNSFLQSIFKNMFGDVLMNERDWSMTDFKSELAHIESGSSPVCDDFSRKKIEWAVLKLGAVTTGIYLPEQNKRLPLNVNVTVKNEVKKHDILFTRKNTSDLVAACAFVFDTPQKLLLPDTVFRFRLKKSTKLSPEFLWAVFNQKKFRSNVQSLASGTAGSMPNISKEKLNDLQIPIPPLPLQEKFAAIVQKFERIRRQQREATRQAEHLFQTLLHRAFHDEL